MNFETAIFTGATTTTDLAAAWLVRNPRDAAAQAGASVSELKAWVRAQDATGQTIGLDEASLYVRFDVVGRWLATGLVEGVDGAFYAHTRDAEVA